MKLGVVGLLPAWEQVDLEAARKVRAAGFRGVSIFFQRPLEVDFSRLSALKEAITSAGLDVAQANGWYEVLVHPDEGLRGEGIRGAQALCRIGRALDAGSVYIRPGSLNPNGAWYPHPHNHTQQTFDRLVDSLRQVSRVAENEGVLIVLEGHVLSPLDTAQSVRDVLDAVGSPALKFNVDPVNFIGSVRDVHDTTRILDELFELLGQDTIAAHMKDLTLRDSLVLHIDEVVPGEGSLDYELFLHLLQETCPDVYCLIEHLPDEKIPQAREAILATAERTGITFDS